MILTGDLGVYGREILIKYMKKAYSVDIGKKLVDSGSVIYDRNKQKYVNAGASGPTAIGIVLFSDVISNMKKKKYKKVLVVGTGALMNTTMNNQKLTIPSISHVVSLEVV